MKYKYFGDGFDGRDNIYFRAHFSSVVVLIYNLEMEETDLMDPFNPFPEPFEMEITDSIDLHAFNAKDIKSVTENYLREAYKKGFRVVKIIHGKGIGVQRELVRKILAETEFVESFKGAPEFSSGAGATIVNFYK